MEIYQKDYPRGRFEEEANYLHAMAGLLLGRQQQAVKEIGVYLKKWPSGRFAADAGYRLGAAHYAMEDYPMAIRLSRAVTAWPRAALLGRVGRSTLPVYVMHVPLLALVHHQPRPPPPRRWPPRPTDTGTTAATDATVAVPVAAAAAATTANGAVATCTTTATAAAVVAAPVGASRPRGAALRPASLPPECRHQTCATLHPYP